MPAEVLDPIKYQKLPDEELKKRINENGFKSLTRHQIYGYDHKDIAHPCLLQYFYEEWESEFQGDLVFRKAVTEYLMRLIEESNYQLTMGDISTMAISFLSGWEAKEKVLNEKTQETEEEAQSD